MTQNNLYMEDDNMRLYVDVQPLFIDELENSKNSAAASAASAAQSEANARTWKNDIINYKTSLELFYAQARDGITNSYNNSVLDLTSVKNLAHDDLNSQKNSIQTSLNNSLNSALNSISMNGQNYVNLAREYAEQAQITVDNRVSKDLLIQSNACKTGSVSTNNDVLTEVYNYAHSTFDASKFTKVGSPIVTSDGIASGFTTSNYLSFSLNYPNSTNWEIEEEFIYNGYTNYGAIISSTTPHFQLYFGGNAENKLFLELANNNGTINDRVEGFENQPACIIGHKYKIQLKRKNNKYDFILNDLTVNTTFSVLNFVLPDTVSDMIINATYRLGLTQSGNYAFNGSIDLKQFSITVDGVEVFSGNKTGIDTIKPNNYTVVGTPTISADGIASGWSTTNYINMSNAVVSSSISNFEFKMKFSPALGQGSLLSNFVYDSSIPQTYGFGIVLDGASRLIIFLASANGTSDWDITGNSGKGIVYANYGITNTDNINLTIGFNGAKYYAKINGVDVTIADTTAKIGLSNNFRMGYTGIWGASNNFSIDLNSVKIYVDGDLVYQPCLKIPYTESKTGSKIVDSVYRDRVNDMAEQFGFAPYYTLSDTDFTLPQVEIYGLIGQKTLRDSYENGINKWYLYSNRDLEQQGSCTSGVEVTLAKPFADTNYVLSVPYSAKSATAFTPTQTGDWFAKGKGVL